MIKQVARGGEGPAREEEITRGGLSSRGVPAAIATACRREYKKLRSGWCGRRGRLQKCYVMESALSVLFPARQ